MLFFSVSVPVTRDEKEYHGHFATNKCIGSFRTTSTPIANGCVNHFDQLIHGQMSRTTPSPKSTVRGPSLKRQTRFEVAKFPPL